MHTATALTVLAGAGLGALVGAVAQLTTFCSVGAVADVILARDWRRLRSWVMAGAVGLMGTQVADAAGLVPLTASIYTPPRIVWLPVGVGSIAFGYGMAMAGGCLQRALVRVGGGSLKSLITIAIMAATAALTLHILTMTGSWGTIDLAMPAGLDWIAATASGLDPHITQTIITSVIAAGLLVFCLKDSWFRKSPGHLWGGAAIGFAVALAWVCWSMAEGPPRGLNLLMDLGNATRSIFESDIDLPVFGGAALIGIVLGAFAVAFLRNDLILDRFVDRDDVRRHILGGVLMGVGGALAGGDSFGQGLSGFSTLSVNALVAIAGMAVGCLWGVRTLEAGSAWGGVRLCFGRSLS